VNQPQDTIFKIKPEEWNNVPSIIYEAIATLVSEQDRFARRYKANNDDVFNNFRDVRNTIKVTEKMIESEIEKVKQHSEEERHTLAERITSLD